MKKDLNKSILISIITNNSLVLNTVLNIQEFIKIIYNYCKNKLPIFNKEYNHKKLLSSKRIEKYIDKLKDKIDENDFKVLCNNTFISNNTLISIAISKDIDIYWVILVKYRHTITLDDFKKVKNYIRSDIWDYLIFNKILSTKEILDFIEDENNSVEDKLFLLQRQPNILLILKNILNYAENKDPDYRYDIFSSVIKNFFYKLPSNKKLVFFPNKEGWFISYTNIYNENINDISEIPLISFSETKYYYKVLKVQVYWKDLLTVKEAKKVHIIKEIDMSTTNIFKRN